MGKGTKGNSSPEDKVTDNSLSPGKEGIKDDSILEDEVTDNSDRPESTQIMLKISKRI